jgi:prevent-host-death family protein
MQSAAIAVLKARLSRYLDRVKAGEEVVVTERGRPIARIVPIRPAGDEEEAQLADLERKGLLRRGNGSIPESFWTRPVPDDPGGLTLKGLLDDREEGP